MYKNILTRKGNMYKSNLFQDVELFEKSTNTINIQIGNNHFVVFDKLKKYKNENMFL